MRTQALPAVLVTLVVLASSVPALQAPLRPSEAQAELAFLGGAEATPCPGAVATRTYDVVAVAVPVSYNHWGDLDPFGRVFVLGSEEQALLQQVAERLAAAGRDTLMRVARHPGLDALSELGYVFPTGLGDFPALSPVEPAPLAQPLVLRARVGECVVVRLTNHLPEAVSLHVHQAVTRPGMGMALGANAPDLTLPGETRSYTAYIPDLPGMEGAHFLHSHADARFHTKHGLFGAIVAEPADASWVGPDGAPVDSGPEAIITRPGASDFREYVVVLHDEVELYDRALTPLPVVSPYGEYGPGTKAINLRAEPFLDRFQHHDNLHAEGELPRGHDKSQAYGSYTYGDAAAFLPRAYVGDPAKFRLVNAGPGQHHVFHLHGGGDRWRSSPVSDETQFDDGLLKHNPVERSRSERTDVQTLGPGESFNLEVEGGAGGVQQSVGDFLYHCHIVEHYVAGMWAVWRVFNTLQPGVAELPDRAGKVPRGGNSTTLLGRTMPDGTLLTTSNLDAWVRAQLPPQGIPGEDDATMWDWVVRSTPRGPLFLGEPEDTRVWPNYRSPSPGERPELGFDPLTGRLSWPFLQPHFGKRPPFAPGHGPAPYLGPEVGPGRPDGLCPADARHLSYNVVAVRAEVPYNAQDADPDGQVYVRAQDKDAILSGAKEARNLVLRANVGDCVDVLLTSQLREAPDNGDHSKVNMHIHLVQFDVQGSDGIVTGHNYEQSVRPAGQADTALAADAGAGADTLVVDHAERVTVGMWLWVGAGTAGLERAQVSSVDGATVSLAGALAHAHGAGEAVQPEATGTLLASDASAGASTLVVADASPLRAGMLVGVGLTTTDVELRTVKGITGDTLTLDAPLGATHGAGQRIGPEFVRYRWYVDADVGMVYWHDHVDGLQSWRHGLFGSLVVEPRGSAWRDPRTGAPVQEGPVADILGPGGAFREVALVLQDRSASIGGRDLASFGLRSAPFDARTQGNPLSSAGNGDPPTPRLEAYAGDPLVVRLLYGANANTRAVGTFLLAGHRFPVEAFNPGSRQAEALSLGISAQHNLRPACGAGGCARLPGDYLYATTQPDLLSRGAWGVVRVHGALQPDLLPLPGFAEPSPGGLPAGPVRTYDLVAMRANVTFNEGAGVVAPVELFALASERQAIEDGALRPMPLVLRALPGEVVEVRLTNLLGTPVSLHAAMLLADPNEGLGIPVGRNPDTTTPAGATRAYRWFADAAVGTAWLTSFGDPARDAVRGLYGALVVEPAGSSFSMATGMSSDLTLLDGRVAREHVLLYASDDPSFEAGVMPYHVDVQGVASVNYRTESLNDRLGRVPALGQGGVPLGGMGVHPCQLNADTCRVPVAGGKSLLAEARHPLAPLVFSEALFGAPETPLLDAAPGRLLIVRALGAAGDQLRVHSISGHTWARDPAMAGSNLGDAATLGPGEASDAWLEAGLGGPGDYLWGDHRAAFLEGGSWGVLRVR